MLYYLIITYIIFIFFTILISIFGGVLIYSLQRWSKKKWNLSLLENLFLSYAIGLLFFIEISYIINYFKIFNFYTILLPIIIVDILFTFFILNEKKFNHIKVKILNFDIKNHKKQVENLIIMIAIWITQFLLIWPLILESSALLAFDPYKWTSDVLYLNQTGRINDVQSSYQGYTYPWGFIFFCGGNLLISGNYTVTFFFMKLSPFPFLNLYLLMIYCLAKRFLKWTSLAFLSSLLVLINSYFIYRIIMFLSSSICVLLILVIFLIILTDTPNWLIGFIIPTIILINPIYSIFSGTLIILFHFLRSIYSYRLFFSTLRDISIIVILSFISLIPYVVIFILLYDKGIDILIKNFIGLFRNPEKNQLRLIWDFSLISTRKISFLLFNFYDEIGSISYYMGEILFYIINMDFLIYICFLGLLLFERNMKQNVKDFHIIIKMGFILVSSIWYIPLFLEPSLFLEIFIIRMYEAFFPCIVFLTSFSIKFIIEKYQKLFQISQ